MNINRDYLIINDVKKSNVKLDNGSIFFYITDKNTQNIFVNLVINVSKNDLIQKYANIENAEDYTLTMNIVKPDNTYKIIEGKLHDKEKAIFEFDLKEDCIDKIGTYRCELLTKCTIDDHEEITTSNKLTYKVKASVLNDLDDIVEAPEYPLVIQLFDKLSDIDQYEEDRRANELARQLAEEQRQTRFDELNADIDNKMADIENRISTKEQAVDTLIADTKTDIDEYKEVKDQEIDNYKTAKDTEINEAITNQNTTINAQNDKISAVENNVVAQNSKLDVLETKATTHDSRLDAIEAKNTEQDGRLDITENRLANIGNDITNTMQPIIDAHTSRLDTIEAIDVAQNNRLDAIEAKNQQQDDRLLDIEKANKKQDMDIKCLFNFHTVDITEEGNSIYLPNSAEGYCEIDNIQGNTLVNCNKEPDKELILNGNINTSGDKAVTLTEGVDGGLVDVALEGNTLVNVSKTKDITALPLDEDLTYLYASTQYTLRFISDTVATVDISLGGTSLLAQSIVAGLNRISITTPATLVDNKLVIDGVGANISEVVVTDTDRVFGYFEDMKSVGQDDVNGHKIEILSQNKNLFNESEHLYQLSMGVGEFNWGLSTGGNKRSIKVPCKPNTTYTFSKTGGDRMVICSHDKDFDGESRNVYMKHCYYNSQASGHIETYTFTTHSDSKVLCIYISKDSLATNIQLEESSSKTNYAVHKSNKKEILLNEPLRAVGDVKDRYVLISGTWFIEKKCGIRAYQEGDKDNYKTDLVNTVYPLEMPTYEEIDYNPLEVYSGTTRITTNSTIPTNIVVKNHGFNCLLKPSTTYTISSNLGLNTVTTPAQLTEDCLRFMDTDTSDVTTMKNVLILEGDWTTKADLIPANFSGIESAFEQEYDAEKGKYRVNAKVANEDKTKENNITFYINEPLRGVGDSKDRVFIQGDKVIVERKCGSKVFDGSDDEIWEKFSGDTFENIFRFSLVIGNEKADSMTLCDKLCKKDYRLDEEFIYFGGSRFMIVGISKAKINSQSVIELKQYLSQNPVTVVYELAEPTYEEVEYNDTKLFIESFKNSTLSYNSNVPVTSKLYYSYSVPIVDTVAQTANVTDQQDSMIIDLATQVAVMEMMLM